MFPDGNWVESEVNSSFQGFSVLPTDSRTQTHTHTHFLPILSKIERLDFNNKQPECQQEKEEEEDSISNLNFLFTHTELLHIGGS